MKFVKNMIIEHTSLFDLKKLDKQEMLNSIATILFMLSMSFALNLVLSGILFKVLDYSTLSLYEIYFNQIFISVLVLASRYSSQCVKIAKMN